MGETACTQKEFAFVLGPRKEWEAKVSRNLGGLAAKKRNEIWGTAARNSGQWQAAGHRLPLPISLTCMR